MPARTNKVLVNDCSAPCKFIYFFNRGGSGVVGGMFMCLQGIRFLGFWMGNWSYKERQIEGFEIRGFGNFDFMTPVATGLIFFSV